MKHVLTLFFCILVMFVKAQTIHSFNHYLQTSNQVLFVKTPAANSIKGKMFLYERKHNNKPWESVDSFPVTVGRSGLAKDVNAAISFNDTLPVKHEGDGKSPSGIFKLWKVFSYHKLENLKMPFVQVDSNFYCVDDVSSRYYNQLILSDTAAKDFNSFEHMKLPGNQYEYGVWVLYNSNPAVAGNGSCIFLHVWSDENTPTSGCTAMAKENMLKLIHWLDEKKKPVLLQVVEK
ncbi:L,D-transpeptidase family protein [Parafilimonas sp.]|uniref:L,D-transpeptidase family protein n=1 Tax=Parafilimonas sp. TaxID=1969739 RepID=UPI0039E2D61C